MWFSVILAKKWTPLPGVTLAFVGAAAGADGGEGQAAWSGYVDGAEFFFLIFTIYLFI